MMRKKCDYFHNCGNEKKKSPKLERGDSITLATGVRLRTFHECGIKVKSFKRTESGKIY